MKRSGFTVTELVVIVLIILLIGAASLMVLNRATRKGMETRARKEIEHLGIVLEIYAEAWGYYPVDLERLDGSAKVIMALEQDANAGYGGKAFVRWPSDAKDSNGNLLDPWGRAYEYFTDTESPWFEGKARGLAYNIWSPGPEGDRADLDTDEYIHNW